MRKILFVFLPLALVACGVEEEAEVEPPIRGLKTHLVENTEQSTVRRFPSVLEPKSLNALSFEVGGKLTEVSLQVGQTVTQGEVLASIDPEALEIQIANAEAGVRSANAAYQNALDALKRQEELFQSGTVTRSALEAAQTDAVTRKAQLDQAEASLDTARENLDNSVLTAPFDGIINSVDVQSFATIAVGTPILTLYSPDEFEADFSANFETVSRLVVGTQAEVRLADRPEMVLDAFISELGSRADAVSSFPVVATLNETDPVLKAGMSVEVSIELPVAAEPGFKLPLTAIIQEGRIEANENQGGVAEVFVFDEASSTVQRREVRVAGVRENSLIIVDGLEAGDRVASAGVSFLRDGQQVKLLSDSQ
ncbi:MAG: efflux RND transporter periplasmic adaptor subunit [Pseudomonadota bacterium]